jgi:hypothetical protein
VFWLNFAIQTLGINVMQKAHHGFYTQHLNYFLFQPINIQ